MLKVNSMRGRVTLKTLLTFWPMALGRMCDNELPIDLMTCDSMREIPTAGPEIVFFSLVG